MTKAGGATHQRPWIIPLVIAGLIVVAIAAWAALQYQRASRLTALLDAATTQIDQLQDQIGQLQQNAAQAAAQLEQARLPDLPVTVSFRRGLPGGGLIAEFHNYTSSELEVVVIVTTNDTTQRKKRLTVVLPPFGMQQVGAPQNTDFAIGQKVELSSEGFRPIETAVQVLEPKQTR